MSAKNSLILLDANQSGPVTQVETLTCVADASGSLDGSGFVLQDDVGSVAFWIDVDNDGTTIPAWASAEDRAVELIGVATDASAATIAAAIDSEISADPKFTAATAVGATIAITHSTAEALGVGVDSSEADGFSFATNTLGTDGSFGNGATKDLEENSEEYVLEILVTNETGTTSIVPTVEHSSDGSNWTLLDTFTTVTADTHEILFPVNSTITGILPKVRVVTTDPGDDASADVKVTLNYKRDERRI
jgi:hypothetical protein